MIKVRKFLPVLPVLAVVCFSLAVTAREKRAAPAARKLASGFDQPSLEPGESWGPENDLQADEILRVSRDMLAERTGQAGFMRRDAHPKHHGCTKAFFKVDASALPPELRSGIFADGAPTEYPAWIRFSNGDPDGAQAADGKSDVRGMAVKLMNVDGARSGSQDFVMCTAKEFFSRDGADYLDLHHALSSGTLALGWYAAWHWSEIRALNRSKVVPGSPLSIEYFSALPYKLGSGVMRFKVTPCSTNPSPAGAGSSPDYLRERLVSELAAAPACFNFYVQPNRDLAHQPIENPMLPWDETASPYVKVATITIPQQTEIDSEPRLNFCENLSFDPWHTLEGTRPLGQISRIRGIVYPGIAEARHQYNGIPMLEPHSHEPCSGETAALCQAPRH